MPSIQQTLCDEIRRLARKEVKIAFTPLKEQIVHLRKRVSELKRQIAELEKGNPAASEAAPAEVTDKKTAVRAKKLRVSAKRIKKLREKIGISQAQFAVLLEVSPFSVCHWELGKTVPRDAQKQRIVAIHKLGKRELKKLLVEKKIIADKPEA